MTGCQIIISKEAGLTCHRPTFAIQKCRVELDDGTIIITDIRTCLIHDGTIRDTEDTS